MNKLSCLIAALAVLTTAAHASDYFVASHGHDANPGTTAQPFATLERARDAIRELKHAGPLKEPVTVRLQGGTYLFLQKPGGTSIKSYVPLTFEPSPGAWQNQSIGLRTFPLRYKNSNPGLIRSRGYWGRMMLDVF
jgi:hypothetical protein